MQCSKGHECAETTSKLEMSYGYVPAKVWECGKCGYKLALPIFPPHETVIDESGREVP